MQLRDLATVIFRVMAIWMCIAALGVLPMLVYSLWALVVSPSQRLAAGPQMSLQVGVPLVVGITQTAHHTQLGDDL